MNNITKCPDNSCTGCSSCFNFCPKGAISMVADSFGHLFPRVDEAQCVDCGLCEKICPALHPIKLHGASRFAYALISNDDNELRTSSSGGAASIISRQIIRNGGIVYGCAQIESLAKIEHVRVDKEENLKYLKGSKYVQSTIGSLYKQVVTDLKAGHLVGFIGTPCQCAGLLAFLRKPYDNLITLDLICHGVPSVKMLVDNAKYNGITDIEHSVVSFRKKTGNNIQFGQYYYSAKGQNLLNKNTPQDDYMAAFMAGLSFRECCHTCRYSASERVGDLTIGDFWKLGAKEKTNLKIKDGISLVLVNSVKGREWLEAILPQTTFELRTLEEAAEGNLNLNHPSVRPSTKDVFKDTYLEKGLHEAVKAALPRTQYYRMALTEWIQQQPFIVKSFKSLRFLFNKYAKKS